MKRLLLGLLLCWPIVTVGQYNRPGSTDAQFLKIGISPRGTAMCDAYIAVVEGAEATYYNSAALPWMKGTDVVFDHTIWFAGINHDFLSAAHDFGDFGSVALSVTGLYTDEMNVTTPLQPDGTGETFFAGNYRFGLTYARFLTDRVSVGATVSYIAMKLYDTFTADAVSVDIAAMYVSDFRGFRFAMMIQHFGSSVRYVNESYPLPTNFTFGMGMNAIEGENHKLLISFAATKPNEGEPLAQIGGEYSFQKLLFLRGGYRINHSVATYALGAGVQVPVSSVGIRADYSYSDYSLLGATHRFGLGVSF